MLAPKSLHDRIVEKLQDGLRGQEYIAFKTMALDFLKRAPAIDHLPADELSTAFRHFRIRVFFSVYFGYSFFYLIRKNISIALPSLMDDLELSKSQMGVALSLFSAAYAVAKLVNGPLLDRANPRFFMALGLAGSAAVNVLFGLSSAFFFLALFWVLNGVFQSMGSPVGPKTIANWFSSGERGRVYGIWNTCHNAGSFSMLLVGGFLIEVYGWRAGFYLPAGFCLVGSCLIAWQMMDRPESVGLPSIQEYHHEVPPGTVQDTDETASQIFYTYVLKNPRLWMLSFACMLIYIVRYGLGDWGITYLIEMKGSSVGWASFKSSFLELMGIPGTILAGYIADRCFRHENLKVAFYYLAGMFLTILMIYVVPKGHSFWDGLAFGLAGFFIYGAQMVCTGLGPLALVPRRAVASAVGLTGAMSYFGAVITSALSGWLTDKMGWMVTFAFWAACAIAAILVLISLFRNPRKTNELTSSF